MEREERIDIMKGLTILLMVVGHSGFIFTDFICLFHMAVFFMISGYLFSGHKVKSVKDGMKYVCRKIKGIWWPYFFWNVVYTLLNNAFLHFGVYSKESFVIEGVRVGAHSAMDVKEMAVNIVKGVFMVGRTEMGGAFWFLRTLFGLSVLFALIDFILNKLIRKDKYADVVHFIISVVFLCCGYAAYLLGTKSVTIPTMLSVYILYFMGYTVKKYDVMRYIKKWSAFWGGLVVLLICNGRFDVSLGSNSYGNPGFLIVCSLAGWMIIYSVADFLSQYRCKRMWVVLGKNSLAIVIHHFWCFKIIHVIQILFYGYPKNSLAAFPYLKANGLWWIAYTVIGAGMPLIVMNLWRKIKEKVVKYTGHAV